MIVCTCKGFSCQQPIRNYSAGHNLFYEINKNRNEIPLKNNKHS